MVARGLAVTLLTLSCVTVAFALAPGALAADPGIAVAEAPPIPLSEAQALVAAADAAAAEAPRALERAPIPAPETRVDVPPAELVTLDAAPALAAPAPSADAVAAQALALVTLADSGLAPEAALARLPSLVALAEEPLADASASVARLTAPAMATGVAGAAAVSLLAPPTPGAFGRFYSRIAPGEALKHPQRRRVYDAIRAEPGIHQSALKDAVGLGNGALLYHLDVLARERLVTKVDAGRFARFFVAGSMPPAEMKSRAALLAGSGEKLFGIVREKPGVAVKDLAEEAGLSVPAVHRALARLESAGLVEKRREGRGHALYPRPEAPLVA